MRKIANIYDLIKWHHSIDESSYSTAFPPNILFQTHFLFVKSSKGIRFVLTIEKCHNHFQYSKIPEQVRRNKPAIPSKKQYSCNI
jgi:hypothetical protein